MGKVRRRGGFKKLLAELKPMPFRKKIDHIWTYYKEYLLVGAVALLIVGGLLTGLHNAGKELLFAGAVVNVDLTGQGETYLTEAYFAHLGGDARRQSMELSHVVFSDLDDPTKAEANYDASMSVLARAAARMLDYAFLDETALEFYIDQELFLDLREFFTPEELDAWAERVIYVQPEGAPEMYPAAIVVTDLPFVKNCVIAQGPVYLALTAGSPRMEMLRDFWTYLQAWEPE